MKVGDLVTSKPAPSSSGTLTSWCGIVVGYQGDHPIVYWDDNYSHEVEYEYHLELVDEETES